MRAAQTETRQKGAGRAVERAQLVADRVGVQQRLRGVLARAVARVDERLLAGAGALLHGAGARVAQHRHVAEGLRQTRRRSDGRERCYVCMILFVELFYRLWSCLRYFGNACRGPR